MMHKIESAENAVENVPWEYKLEALEVSNEPTTITLDQQRIDAGLINVSPAKEVVMTLMPIVEYVALPRPTRPQPPSKMPLYAITAGAFMPAPKRPVLDDEEAEEEPS